MTLIQKLFALICFFLLGNIEASSNLLLKEKGSNLKLHQEFKIQKLPTLDDPFVIQLYNSWKALGDLSPKGDQWIQNILFKKYSNAFLELEAIDDEKLAKMKRPIELYLLYKLGHIQALFELWIDYSSKEFLHSELSISLDQVIGLKASELLLKSGFSLTKSMSEKLFKVEKEKNRTNTVLQAHRALKTGENTIDWIGRLPENDRMRFHLGYSAVLHYAKKGMLGASGKIMKKVIGPWIEKSEDHEEIALYYMTLGRLLYQAKAFKQSLFYYGLIPESSRYFIEARVESLWSSLQQRDFSKTVGELASLELDIYKTQFNPEVFLVKSIAHTMLCQFDLAEKSIAHFVKFNRPWANKISKNSLKENETKLLDENFYTRLMKSQIKSLQRELNYFTDNKLSKYVPLLKRRITKVNGLLDEKIRLQWQNRRKILEEAIYKMKFVRIELISRMNLIAQGLKDEIPNQDMVGHYQASVAKGNQILFPHDGVIWSDDLFHMRAEVRNRCLKDNFL